MLKFKILHNRPDCIGCSACETVAPEFWLMKEDGKSSIIDGKEIEDGWEEREIDEDGLEANKLAAKSCPVDVIHLVHSETNEKVA